MVTVTRIDEAFRRISTAEGVLQRVIARRWPERDETDTDIRWGRAGDYPDDGGGPQIISPLPPEDEEDEPPGIPVWREVQKKLELVRIENPDDAEQWVETKRRVWSLMQNAETGAYELFEWDNSDID